MNSAKAWEVHYATSEDMRHVRDASVQSVICSPPYWDLKDYGHDGQIGYGENYERYHNRMDKVWSECLRKLRPDGTMWIVIDKVWHDGRVVPIPYHIAKRCQALGFVLQDLVIWNKPTAIAGMHPRNSVNKHETIVVLSKTKVPKIETARGGQAMGPDRLPSGRLSDLWRVVVKAGNIRKTPDHKAPYPDELIARLVALSTDPGDLVLDPFLGSGTTAMISVTMGRRAVGYEINPDFREMIEARLADAEGRARDPALQAIAR